jgi:hypothetical protein
MDSNKKQTKKELVEALNNLDIQLNRVIKIAEVLGEPEDRVRINILIDQIIDITNNLRKYE